MERRKKNPDHVKQYKQSGSSQPTEIRLREKKIPTSLCSSAGQTISQLASQLGKDSRTKMIVDHSLDHEDMSGVVVGVVSVCLVLITLAVAARVCSLFYCAFVLLFRHESFGSHVDKSPRRPLHLPNTC